MFEKTVVLTVLRYVMHLVLNAHLAVRCSAYVVALGAVIIRSDARRAVIASAITLQNVLGCGANGERKC